MRKSLPTSSNHCRMRTKHAQVVSRSFHAVLTHVFIHVFTHVFHTRVHSSVHALFQAHVCTGIRAHVHDSQHYRISPHALSHSNSCTHLVGFTNAYFGVRKPFKSPHCTPTCDFAFCGVECMYCFRCRLPNTEKDGLIFKSVFVFTHFFWGTGRCNS